MSKHFFTIGLLLIAISGSSQTLELDIQKNKLADFLKIENDLGSQKIENNSYHLLRNGVAQPIQFKRKEIGLPDLICYYFYLTKDSSIDYILYEWDDTNSKGNEENAKKTQEELKYFIDKYNELYSQIFGKFGESKSEGDLADLSKIETGNFRKKDIWNTDKNIQIELFTVLSSRYEKKGIATINPTYRIRLYIRNLNR